MMSEWKACKLGDVVNLKRGYDLPHRERTPGPYPIISSSGVTDYHDEGKVKGPGVVTGRYGTLGQVFYVETDFWPLNTSLYVEDFRGNDPRFISYFLGQLNFGTQNAAGAVPGVNRNHLHALDVRVPPVEMQRRIAGILSAYDELIANSQHRIQILESMARALYREWFVNFRFPGHEKVRRVPSEMGEIPEGWRVGKLSDIAEEMRRNVSKGEIGDSQFYVGLEHIPRRSLALDTWVEIAELGSNKLRFMKGEVLFGKIRPYFHKVSIAPFDGLCSADTIVIRAKERHQSGLVSALVSSDEFVSHATATSNGSKMPRANWSVLRNYDVSVPPVPLARLFSDIFTDLTSLQQHLVATVHNLRCMRDLLLPRLLSGRIVDWETTK